MTTAADDSADEIAFEAFLAGRAVPAGPDGSSSAVVTFAGAVRATATLPGRPTAALADLLTTGLLTDQSSPSTRTAPSTGKSPRRSRVRRRRFAMFLPALVAKFLSLSAVAQAASGVGIAVVAFTGAGASGLLGNDVQTTLTSAVGAAAATTDVSTPTASPSASPTAVQTPAVETPAVQTPASVTPRSAADAQLAGPTPGEKFGDWVHEAFPDGKADGRLVSSWARQKHVDLSKVQGIDDVEGIDDSGSSTATRTPEVETEHSTAETHGDSGHGGGNSGNSGHGRD